MPAYLISILVIVFLGIGYVAISYGFAYIILHPKRQPIAETPADYGLKYEDIEFKSTDGLSLKGWFIPGKLNKIVVVTHPMWCNRHGYLIKNQSRLAAAKTDISLFPSIKALNQAGYPIVTFDFRNHGESGGKGMAACGLNEYNDVLGVMNYLNNEPKFQSLDITFVGFCMGANSMIIAMNKAKEQFKRVKCFVAVQPVTLGVFVRSYLKSLYSFIGLALFPMISVFVRWQGGVSINEMSPRKFVKGIMTPILYVQTRTDPWTELSDIEGFYKDTPEPKEFWWLEEKMSRLEGYNYIGQHPERMIQFLQSHL